MSVAGCDIETIIRDWHRLSFPFMYPNGNPDDRLFAAKLAEEAGEVCGATIKILELRKTLDDLYGELGDVLVTTTALLALHGWTIERCLIDKMNEILAGSMKIEIVEDTHV